MYNVLLVDDEKYAVKGLAAGMDWEALGITAVMEAYDVGQAKELLSEREADIVILDIEMPGQSGLNLAEWLREQHPHAEVIFLTGHANFNYAQQALSMGAFRYLLKPVDHERLAEIILQLLDKIRSEREMQDYRSVYRKYYSLWESQKPLLVERFWQEVIQGRTAFLSGKLDAALRQYDIPLAAEDRLFPVLISIEQWQQDFGARDEEIMEYAIRKAAEELVLDGSPGMVVGERSGSGLILFYRSAAGEAEAAAEGATLEEKCMSFIQSCNEYFHCRLSCYIGGEVGITGLEEAYQRLLEAERANVTRTNSVIIPSAAGKPATRPAPPPPLAEWALLLDNGGRGELTEQLNRYFSRLEKEELSVETLQAVYFGLAHLCLDSAVKKGVSLGEALDGREEAMTLSPVKSLAALRQWCGRLLEQYWTGAAVHGEPHQQSSIIAKIKEFAQQHPQEELGREQLASHVFLNPAYLSRLFRKETGQSLTEYVLEVKIGHARRLLEESNLKVGAVAEAIGYTHFSYFAKLFKKMTGLSPHEYRKKHRRLP
ncbi:MAG: response regulator [Paenibacillaceae bacterium]|nr:response regulator [Paenibacillaceae bacterium]